MRTSVSLSMLVASRRNPRRVRPEREAHRRLVASIRAHGLLQPLVVREASEASQFVVIAGNRRLAALREVHRGENPKIPCVVREAAEKAAEALSLAENFAREAMHPLDEAEAFARLAQADGKDGQVIAAEFGVTPHYVRQRMKLAMLAGEIKDAYRMGQIDTAMAEAFASVPPERQLEIWKEVGGHPRHAEHVRNIIANGWIDARHAVFDIATLSEPAVSQDLFGQRVLVERKAFLEAQAAALAREKESLVEAGWKEVVLGERGDVQDRLWSMTPAEVRLDKATRQKLKSISRKWEKLEKKLGTIDGDDQPTIQAIQRTQRALEAEEERISDQAPKEFSEATKAAGTVFLMLDPDGQVRREYRVATAKPDAPGRGGSENRRGEGSGQEPQAPTSDDLSDKQLATTFTHQAIAVREVVLTDRLARKRLLVMILHYKVRSEALAVRQDANGTTLHAQHSEGFTSPAWKKLLDLRAGLDPFKDTHYMEDIDAYQKLKKLKEPQLDKLIELLTVESLTAHLQRSTALVAVLAGELGVEIRRHWTPDAAWLGSYQKCQLAHLIVELRGPVHAPPPERKKSELVASLAELFATAAAGKLEEVELGKRLNAWLPANLREQEPRQPA